jgi:IS30 family transposase
LKRGSKYISYTKRLIIENCLNADWTIKDIAEKIGMSERTVYREINRGKYEKKVTSYVDYWGETHYKNIIAYSADIAQERYEINKTAKGVPLKIGNDFEFVAYVEKRVLQDKLTPHAVWVELKKFNPFKTKISKPTLYRYIELGIFANIVVANQSSQEKKRYRKAKAKRPPRGTSIEMRSDEISQRKSFGNWEMDCVCGPTLPVLLVLSERLTRKEIIFRMPNQKAECVVKCLNILERKFGKDFKKIFKTITVDNGSEFSDFKGMEKSIFGKNSKRTLVYYCHPYSSFERGTNERLNREIRRLIPKGSDISKYSDSYIKYVEDWLNNFPREVLGCSTANELYEKEIANL